jgi:tetratricopeptide (TPR) repeat protein
MYVSDNKIGNAEKPYERSIECDQNLCYGYFKLGNLFKRRNQQEKTQEYYAKALRCSPKNPEFLYAFASVYDQWGQTCAALNLYKDLFEMLKHDKSAKYSIDDIGNHISRLEKQYSCN